MMFGGAGRGSGRSAAVRAGWEGTERARRAEGAVWVLPAVLAAWIPACAEGGDSYDTSGDRSDVAHDDGGGDGPIDGESGEVRPDGDIDDGGESGDGGGLVTVVPRPLGISANTQDLVVDAEDRVSIIWTDGRTLWAGRLVDGEVTGQVEVSAPELSTRAARPLAAVRPDGSALYVVWVGPVATDAERVHLAESDAAGVWREETVLSQPGFFFAEPAVGAGGDGSIHVVAQRWAPGAASEPTVYLWRRPGGGWSEPVLLSPVDGPHRDITAFTDPEGGVHVGYAGINVAYYRHAPSGSLLSEVPQLETPHRDGVVGNYFGDLFVEPGGRAHRSMATWTRDSQVTVDHSVRPPGGAWELPTVASGGPIDTTGEARSAVGAARDETVFVLWSEMPAGANRCRLAVRRDGDWVPQTIDDEAGFNAQRKPSIAVTADAVVAVWRHGDGQLWIADLWRRP